MLISLIGYRGTGKSTVARLVALRLGWDWVDADVEIELRAGKSIAAIFADDGEQAFRDLESQIVAELAARDGSVIALGGGAILRKKTALAETTVVWLQASIDTILSRVAADPVTARRPNLTIAGGRQEIETLLAVREPIYREMATVIVNTDDKLPEQIADEIVAAVA